MVKLNKIYTKTGDSGETGLVGGERVVKHSLRVVAYGEVDEANSAIGLARVAFGEDSTHISQQLDRMLARIQNDLFDCGADLATPNGEGGEAALRIVISQVERLEQEIDQLNEKLDPLTSFVLPGGRATAANLHLARCVVRRAERAACALAEKEAINPLAIYYLNRLSDHLFVLARVANNNGKADILWVPGENR